MNPTHLFAGILLGIGGTLLFQHLRVKFDAWTAARASTANVTFVSPETMHDRILQHWRDERLELERNAEDMRNVLVQIRRAELAGDRIPPSHRRAAERAMKNAGIKICELNEVIAEDEKAHRL